MNCIDEAAGFTVVGSGSCRDAPDAGSVQAPWDGAEAPSPSARLVRAITASMLRSIPDSPCSQPATASTITPIAIDVPRGAFRVTVPRWPMPVPLFKDAATPWCGAGVIVGSAPFMGTSTYHGPVLRTHPDHPNLRLFDHPLIQQKLARLRDVTTTTEVFRMLLNQVAGLMTFQISGDFPTVEVELQTPLERTTGLQLAHPVTLVPILRAGIGMTEGMLTLMPEARVGHVGSYRDEATFEPVSYYFKVPPDIAEGSVIVVDPMLATGGSAVHACDELRRLECPSIRFICLVCAPEGVLRMEDAHPDIEIYAASLDRGLDERKYIMPGLGDAGDRIFGTQ